MSRFFVLIAALVVLVGFSTASASADERIGDSHLATSGVMDVGNSDDCVEPERIGDDSNVTSGAVDVGSSDDCDVVSPSAEGYKGQIGFIDFLTSAMREFMMR